METIKVYKTSDVKFGCAIKKGEEEKYFDINFSLKAKEKLEKDLVEKDIDYPVNLELSEKDYFITSRTYNEKEYYKIVVTDYQNVTEAEKRNNLKIADLFN